MKLSPAICFIFQKEKLYDLAWTLLSYDGAKLWNKFYNLFLHLTWQNLSLKIC